MTATRAPGIPVIEDDELVTTNPATGAEVGRYPVATAEAYDARSIGRTRRTAWWDQLGFADRRARLLR